MNNIEDYIPFGKENAIKREQLSVVTGCSDRIIRMMIADARKRVAIINIQDGNGYYRPRVKELDEAKTQLKQEMSRIKNINKSLKALKQFIKSAEFCGGNQ